MNTNVTEMAQRIERLERNCLRLKRLSTVVVLVVGLAALMGQAGRDGPMVIKAPRFVVVDDDGKERAVLGLENGSPVLLMRDNSGRAVVRCEVPRVPDKPAIYFNDPDGRSGLELALTMNGPVLHFSDASGTRLRLATNELNAPLVAVYDEQGGTLFDVSAAKPDQQER